MMTLQEQLDQLKDLERRLDELQARHRKEARRSNLIFAIVVLTIFALGCLAIWFQTQWLLAL